MSLKYIGFADSEKFVEAVDKARPVNLNVNRRHGKQGKYGIGIDSTDLIMSQAQGDEVLYFMATVDRYQVMNGEILEPGRAHRVEELADQVMEAARALLTDRGLSVREALLSMPASLEKMVGDASFLRYDKERGYSYALRVDAAAEADGGTP